MLGIAFEHRAVSVFTTFEQFRQINPVVKAPSLVCDDGEVLMIRRSFSTTPKPSLDRAESMPSSIPERQHALRIIGLALAACEKTVQIVYERNLRPVEKQHAPWLDRVRGQLLAAYAALDLDLRRKPIDAGSKTITQAGITSAVAWQFTQVMLPKSSLRPNTQRSRHSLLRLSNSRNSWPRRRLDLG